MRQAKRTAISSGTTNSSSLRIYGDGKMVKNIFSKIGRRLRLAHEENDHLSITTEIIKHDENLAVVKAVTSTMKGNFPGLGMASVDRHYSIAEKVN